MRCFSLTKSPFCPNREVLSNLILQEVKMRMNKKYTAPMIEAIETMQNVDIVTASSWTDETGGEQGRDDPF